MNSKINSIREYQQKVFAEYSNLKGIPNPYTYPEGSLIRALPPIQTNSNGLMVIGAYPSARFEYRKAVDGTDKYRLIPIANIMQPFADEEYFDGLKVRKLESTVGLRKYLLDPLSLQPIDCWLTNLVKVFLYKKEHLESCGAVVPNFKVQVLRDYYWCLGKESLKWIQEKIQLCQPKIVVTLGIEVAQVVSGYKNAEADVILNSEVTHPENLNGVPTIYAPHPDSCRRFRKWRDMMKVILILIKNKLQYRFDSVSN